MRAIVLAAGKGERLKGITMSLPKPMIKVNGKPIIEHTIEWLKSYGIEEIYINLHHIPQKIVKHFGNGSKFGVRITYSFENELLGTAGAVKKIADEYFIQLRSELEPFLVVYGDNLYDYSLLEIINFHKIKKGIATIALYEKEDVSQSGIVLLDNDSKIMTFIEKPKQAISNLVNTGTYILEPSVLNYIPPNKMVDFGKDVFPEMIRKKESIYGLIVKGNLIAIDTLDLLRKVI